MTTGETKGKGRLLTGTFWQLWSSYAFYYFGKVNLSLVIPVLLVTYKDTSSAAVSALIADLSLPAWSEGDGTLEFDITLALSGKITFTDVP